MDRLILESLILVVEALILVIEDTKGSGVLIAELQARKRDINGALLAVISLED